MHSHFLTSVFSTCLILVTLLLTTQSITLDHPNKFIFTQPVKSFYFITFPQTYVPQRMRDVYMKQQSVYEGKPTRICFPPNTVNGQKSEMCADICYVQGYFGVRPGDFDADNCLVLADDTVQSFSETYTWCNSIGMDSYEFNSADTRYYQIMNAVSRYFYSGKLPFWIGSGTLNSWEMPYQSPMVGASYPYFCALHAPNF